MSLLENNSLAIPLSVSFISIHNGQSLFWIFKTEYMLSLHQMNDRKYPSYLEKSSISFWIDQRGRQRADLEGRDFQGLFILTGNGQCQVAVCSWGYTDLYSISCQLFNHLLGISETSPWFHRTFPLLPASPVTQGLLNIIANDPKLPRLLLLTSQQQMAWPSQHKNTEDLVWSPKGQEGAECCRWRQLHLHITGLQLWPQRRLTSYSICIY